jgi:hypothetical protein
MTPHTDGQVQRLCPGYIPTLTLSRKIGTGSPALVFPMDTFSSPFLITVEAPVGTGTVVVVLDGVIVGELEFPAFVFLIAGILHPATSTKPTIRKRVRGMIILKGIRDFFSGV